MLPDGRDVIDKFEEYGLTRLPSKYVKPAIIAECAVNLAFKGGVPPHG